MATRSFLLDSQTATGREILCPEDITFPAPERTPKLRHKFSLWLEKCLIERLNSYGDFAELKPILLGSWARHELCPKSDIDLLFVGDEGKVKEFTSTAIRSGLKLRARTPEDLNDWTVGVDAFDVLALQSALPYAPRDEALLTSQAQLSSVKPMAILSAIRSEREERRKRQDSISNYLEPNLKFGAGGLRDIEQALAVKHLFPEKFADTSPYPFKVLGAIKDELLYLRSLLHLQGSGDILSAADQLELARLFRMDSAQQLMKFLQSELERANFYADWAVANAVATKSARTEARLPLTSFAQLLQRLDTKPSLLLQYEIRLVVDRLLKPLSPLERGKALHKLLYSDNSDAFLLALYRARVLEALIPDLKKLRGLVQHDHYHRFTADAHLVQTLREVQRAKTQKRSLGAMSKLTRDLSAQEWLTLKLVALFHDLAKGRKGDHSSEGARLVEKYFAEWEYPAGLLDDVRWLVDNHLILSTAAFRQNPQAQSTWKRLFERGVQGRRLVLLALFTAIDIRATNPEAWTDWKSQLLLNLVQSMRSPEAQGLQRHLSYARKTGGTEDWLLKVDPVLLQNLSPRTLLEDLRKAGAAPRALPPLVVAAKNRVWVRFHSRQDSTGLFLSFVQRLYGFGLNIQLSSVSTITEIGVYDWFCLRTEKSARQIGKWLELEASKTVPIPKVVFQSIDLMAQDQEEWIFSFRGRDQRGLLLAAAHALVEEKLSLRWARAHTWGQQIDDIFSVQPLGEVENTLARLRGRFVT